LHIDQSEPIEFEAAISLDFTFGVDGNFYAADPQLKADLTLGDAPLAVHAADTTANAFTVLGDHTSASTSEAVTFATGDNFYVTGSLDNPGLYTVVSATTSTDDEGETVTVIVVDELLTSDTASGAIYKAFDLSATLGPLGVGIEDGIVHFSTEVGIGVPGMLEFDTFTADTTGSLLGLPTLDGDTSFELMLPIVPQGVLAEMSAGTALISASSTLIPEDAGLVGFFTNLPNTISLSGFEDLFRFKGLSLDTILDALESSLDDLVGMDREVVGKINGSMLEVYEEIWAPTGSTVASGSYTVYTDPDTSAQPTMRVTLGDGSRVMLQQWTSSGSEVWGVEQGFGASLELVTYSLDSWKLADSYDTSDVTATAVDASAYPNANINGGSTDTLGTYRLQDGLLYDEVPIIGVRGADVFGDTGVSFIESLHDAISTVRNTARNIHELGEQLDAKVRDLLSFMNLDPNEPLITMNYANSAFDFEFHLEKVLQKQFNIDLNLEDLDLSGMLADLASNFTVTASAPIDIEASLGLHLGFGFDLSNVFEPIFYVDQESGIDASITGSSSDLDFTLAIDVPDVGGINIPELGIHVIDGTAELELGFYANLGDPNADLDGNGILEVSELGGAFQAEAYGSAVIDLPLFFPIESMPFGLTTDDRNADGIPDHTLHASAEFSLDDSLDLQTGYEFVLPGSSMSFNATSMLIAWLNDPATVLSGLESFFDGVDAAGHKIGSIELPLIGGDPFQSMEAKITGLRTTVLGTLDPDTGDYSDGSLGKWLQDQATAGNSTAEGILNEIRQWLYDGLKDLNDELFAFVVPQ
ncbi:MAG: hypothetical protein KDB23_26675, partial [Planctomycetales bacterium]|nr:hypothetical protein [Planctomycetales bacterium]